jgi:hypothetical protein
MGELRRSELSGSVGSAKRKFGAAHGGSVRMFGIAIASGKIERRALRRSSCWSRDHLPDRALASLGHAVAGQCEAAWLTAVPATVPLKAAQAPSGACADRSVRTGSERYCKALIVGVSPAAAVAVFSYATNPGPRHAPAVAPSASACASPALLGLAGPRPRIVMCFPYKEDFGQ